jgi:hypothetical protein
MVIMIDRSCADADTVAVVAPNGVTWTRAAGGRSSPADLLRELTELGKDRVEREWDWWQEGRAEQEQARRHAVLGEWDNGAARAKTQQEHDASVAAMVANWDRRREIDKQQRADRAAKLYSKERERVRLDLMRAQADAAFFAHVLDEPASKEQQHAAELRLAERQATAQQLRNDLGDPDDVVDRHGFLPAERRTWSLSSHMTLWRHPMLRELNRTKQRRRFARLLAMRPPAPSDMCSECEAPSLWHEYALSLCLFRPDPPAGSTAEKLANLMPGWWQRCSVSTAYQLEHQWGGKLALPDFTGEQWRAMLPALLREIFAPKPPKARKACARREPLAVIPAGTIDSVLARLTDAKAKFPDADVRSGSRGGWELWPKT